MLPKAFSNPKCKNEKIKYLWNQRSWQVFHSWSSKIVQNWEKACSIVLVPSKLLTSRTNLHLLSCIFLNVYLFIYFIISNNHKTNSLALLEKNWPFFLFFSFFRKKSQTKRGVWRPWEKINVVYTRSFMFGFLVKKNYGRMRKKNCMYYTCVMSFLFFICHN